MVIKSLKLKNYRNYDLLDLTFDPKTNILYGDNAQGKTNILEALYLSGTTKSHRGTKDRDIIQFGHDESHLETIVEKKGITFQIDMHLKKNSPKGIAIDKMPIRRAGELFGIVHFVFFSPEDLNIIKDGPAGRRRFIDLELSQLDHQSEKCPAQGHLRTGQAHGNSGHMGYAACGIRDEDIGEKKRVC